MLTDEQIIHALGQKTGNITDAAKALKVTRQALYKRIGQSETLQSAVIDSRETFIDVAESELLRLVKRGNTAAIIFTLKTLGKGRGYIERQEIEHRLKDVSQLTDEELRAIVATKGGG